jgi:hypothetical protein
LLIRLDDLVITDIGPYLHSLELRKLEFCRRAIKADKSTFGIDCVRTLLDIQEISVTYQSENSRIKKAAYDAFNIERSLPAMYADSKFRENSDILIIWNATVLTMASGEESRDVLHNGTIVIRNGLIAQILYKHPENLIPSGAKIIDVKGGIVVPGFIDAHAHWEGGDLGYVASSWEHRTFLAYGCTTMHK